MRIQPDLIIIFKIKKKMFSIMSFVLVSSHLLLLHRLCIFFFVTF